MQQEHVFTPFFRFTIQFVERGNVLGSAEADSPSSLTRLEWTADGATARAHDQVDTKASVYYVMPEFSVVQ
jgi:hypothetical protein